MYSEKNSIKLLVSPFLLMFQTYFSALQRHLGTQRTLGHWGNWELKAREYLGTQKALRHSGTQGTWALEGYLGTQALNHSGTWAFEALEALYSADSTTNDFSYIEVKINYS